MTSQTETLTPEVFLELVDAVLIGAGRKPLEAGNRAIVAVTANERVLQILAGPGSGKTEMLVWRVLYELLVLGTPARRVMVTTFTRKAATELGVRLVERSDALLALASKRQLSLRDPHVHDLRVGTIHSLCDALLAEYDEKYMAAGTHLLDEQEATVRLFKQYRFLGYNGPSRPPRTIDRLLACPELVALFRPPWDDTERWPANNMQRVKFLSALLGQHTETWIPRCGASGAVNGIEVVHPTAKGLTNDLEKLRARWSDYLENQQLIDFTTLQLIFHQRQNQLLEQLDRVRLFFVMKPSGHGTRRRSAFRRSRDAVAVAGTCPLA